ncbi:hypothetical protein [Bacillus sp. FJAT-29814]|uniref:hypothetical protein n=1 Tax=Bacillus sp. FJAT-29814 TaxID=1729688 RepID=UPI00082B2C2A|nr:hypothetical protein [Bacillus sp. FJAT-29814]
MGLFINNSKHPDVFKNNQVLNEPNQAYSRRDFLTEFMKDESLNKQELMEKVKQLSQSIEEMANRLEKNEMTNQLVLQQVNEQLELQKETAVKISEQEELQLKVAEKLEEQEERQTEVLTRLDTQEALVDKITHQLNHIRSILFERTNYLAGKIEEGYRVTSSYVYKLMTGTDKPLTFFLMNQKKEENQQKMD